MTESTTEAPESADQPDEGNAADSAKAGGGLILVLIVVSLTWYLLADRYTPYTSQARVQGYVVGVAPKVAGVVTKVWVTNNEAVALGDPLFQIDPSQYEIALDRARSDVESARRQVGVGSAGVETARAQLKAAQANLDKASKNSARLERLHGQDPGTISTRQLEIARASLDQARAGVAAAEAGIQAAIEQMGGEDDANNTILKKALSALAKAELDLANTTVKASSSGIITDLRADVGQYAGTGSPMMTLVAIHDVWISAAFTENNLGHLRVGTPVEIVFDVLPGAVFQGEVRSIGLGVDDGQTTSPGTLPSIKNDRDWLRQSQRFPVIIGFDARDQMLQEHLRIGGQTAVIAYPKDFKVLNVLGNAYIRAMSWLSFAY